MLKNMLAAWQDFYERNADPRTKDWPLVSSPLPTILLIISYVVFCKVIGPRMMENRKPFQLRKVLIVYNFLQLLLSAKIFYDSSRLGWLTTYSWRCEPVDKSTSPRALEIAGACYLYFLSKFTEFLDTIFFVLRKRFDQISTLHMIHHSIMPFNVWWGMMLAPGGHGTFFGFLNSGVHVVMYLYYMLAAIGPQMQKYLWWKKYLTALQMVQFVAIMAHSFQLFFHNPCGYPILFSWLQLLQAFMFFALFKIFYKEAYSKKKKDDDVIKRSRSQNISVSNIKTN